MLRVLFALFIFSFWLTAPADVTAADTATNDQDWFKADESAAGPLKEVDLLPVEKMTPLQKLSSSASDEGFISETSAVALPDCDDSRLTNNVLRRIAQYYASHPNNTIIEKRRQILLQKNLSDFKNIDIDTFSAKENIKIADKLISYKINKGLNSSDIRLCKSTSSQPFYLIIYPQNNIYTVEIVNFPGQPNSEKFITTYD